MWNIRKIVSKGDYNYAIVPEHPHRTKNNYVLEHRVIMENHLGRLLNSNEVVHHVLVVQINVAANYIVRYNIVD